MSQNITYPQNLQNFLTQINKKGVQLRQFKLKNHMRESNNHTQLHKLSHQDDQPFLNIIKLNQLQTNSSSRDITHGIRRRRLPLKKQKTEIKEKRIANKEISRYPHPHELVIDFKLFSDELQYKIENKAKKLQQAKKKTEHLENYYNNLVLEYIKDNNNKQKEKNNLKHIFVYKTTNHNKIIQIEYKKKKPLKIAPMTTPVYSKEDKSYQFKMLDSKQKKKWNSKQLIDVDHTLSNDIMITTKPFTSFIKNRRISGSPMAIERKSLMIQNSNPKKIKSRQKNFSIMDNSKFRINMKKKISDFKVQGWQKEDREQELFNSNI